MYSSRRVLSLPNTQFSHQPEVIHPKLDRRGYLGVRHMQALLMFLALTIEYSIHGILMVTLFFYYKLMFEDKSLKKIGIIACSFFIAHGVCVVLSGYASYKINNKFLLVSSVLVVTALTYLTPLITKHYGDSGFWTVIFVRGIFKAVIAPAVCCQMSRWVPRSEINVTVPCVLAGTYFGVGFALSLSKNLTQQGNWETAFYFSGNCALVWLIAFGALGAQAPSSCWYISHGEKTYIEHSVSCRTMSEGRIFVPFREILKNIPSVALIISGSCHIFVAHNVVRIMTYVLYEECNLNDSVADILLGGLICFCVLLTYPMAYLVQRYFVKTEILNKNTQRFVLSSIGRWILGSCLLMMVNADSLTTYVIYSVIMYTFNNILNMGLYTTAFDMSPNYVGILMAWIMGVGTMTYALSLFFYQLLIDHYGIEISWRANCAMSGALCFLGNLVFTMFGSCEVQEYDHLEAFVEED